MRRIHHQAKVFMKPTHDPYLCSPIPNPYLSISSLLFSLPSISIPVSCSRSQNPLPSRHLRTINTSTTNAQSSCGYYTPSKCRNFPILNLILITFSYNSIYTCFRDICSIFMGLGGFPRTAATTVWSGYIGPKR